MGYRELECYKCGSLNLTYSLFTDLLVILRVEGRGVLHRVPMLLNYEHNKLAGLIGGCACFTKQLVVFCYTLLYWTLMLHSITLHNMLLHPITLRILMLQYQIAHYLATTEYNIIMLLHSITVYICCYTTIYCTLCCYSII